VAQLLLNESIRLSEALGFVAPLKKAS